MAIKDLAVAYAVGKNADAALSHAVELCRGYGAELTALHVHVPLAYDDNVIRWAPKEILDHLKVADAESAGKTEAHFRDRIGALGFEGVVHWRVENGTVSDQLCRMARTHDLLVMGRMSDQDNPRQRISAEELVLRAGRPVLIVPPSAEPRSPRGHAVIAWDGSRPAARALSDALQILESKARIDVVTVGPKERMEQRDRDACEVVRHLERHGVDARRVFLESGKEGVGAAILRYCDQSGPDMLVMGAYGHTRLREDLFGGVTRFILDRMVVPVLMSH